MHALNISKLVKRYVDFGHYPAVDAVDISLDEGMILVLLGPSGCGKTTLLRCVAGLESPQSGKIALGQKVVFDAAHGINVPTHKRDIGLVFQNYSLWPHMTVAQNVEYPLIARGKKSRDRAKRTKEMLELVRCDQLAGRSPAMLSGGQQQRIALARALAPEPEVLLLDEPLSNLDALLRVELRSQLRAIHRKLGFTAIYVTHDQTEAFALGSRVAVMNHGRIEQFGTPEEVYTRPATEYVAQFVGIRNSLSIGEAVPAAARRLLEDANISPAADVSIYLRPECIDMDVTDSNTPENVQFGRGRVVDCIELGNAYEYSIDMCDVQLVSVRSMVDRRWLVGDDVSLSISRNRRLIYRRGAIVSP